MLCYMTSLYVPVHITTSSLMFEVSSRVYDANFELICHPMKLIYCHLDCEPKYEIKQTVFIEL